MTEIQSYSNLLSVILSTQGLQMNGQHCFWLHWFLLGNEVRFLSIACNCNLFISLAMKMLFFHCNNKWIQRSVTRPQDGIQVDARKIYPSEVDWIELEFFNDHIYNRKSIALFVKFCTRKLAEQYLNAPLEGTNLPLLLHYLQFV